MYIYIYIYIHIYAYIYTCICRFGMHLYMYTYIYIYWYMYTYIYIYVYIHIYAYTYTCIYRCRRICTYVYIYIYMYIYIDSESTLYAATQPLPHCNTVTLQHTATQHVSHEHRHPFVCYHDSVYLRMYSSLYFLSAAMYSFTCVWYTTKVLRTALMYICIHVCMYMYIHT